MPIRAIAIVKRLPLVVALLATGLAGSPPVPAAAAPPSPGHSTSRYMETVDPLTAFDEGCELGLGAGSGLVQQDSVSILAFGMPVGGGGQPYGASLFGNGGATAQEIAEAVVAYANGFGLCSFGNPAARAAIGIGTSNFGSRVSREHGRAWGAMVEGLAARVATGFAAGRVEVVGANDIEQDWSSPQTARDWIAGYRETTGRPLLNFGAASGCPQRSASGGACNGGWTQGDVLSVSTGNTIVVPQIYAQSGANARQWAMLSLLAARTAGAKLDLRGSLTQLQACIDVQAACSGTRNTPAQGWSQLVDALAADPATAATPSWATDIRWAMTGPLRSIGLLSAGGVRPSAEKRAIIARQRNWTAG